MRIQIQACCRNRLYASRNLILYFAVVFVILVWVMTFANTRALLEDFSALEIQLLRFALAWAMLWVWEGGGVD